MSEALKLTAPQQALLRDIKNNPGRYVAPNYPSLKVLLRHDFVFKKVGKYGDGYSINESGEQHLKSLEPK